MLVNNEFFEHFKVKVVGTSLVVQWLGLQASTAESTGSNPGQGINILHTMWPKKKKKFFFKCQHSKKYKPV